jgi:hypothetical protein
MKKTILSLLLLPVVAQAGNLRELYWSPYACSGHIYQFDDITNEYKEYTREYIKKDNEPKHISYRLIEGKIMHAKGSIYSLLGNNINGKTTINFASTNQAFMKLPKYGLLALKTCDIEKSRKPIYEAEIHFKKCPKNDINCKSY